MGVGEHKGKLHTKKGRKKSMSIMDTVSPDMVFSASDQIHYLAQRGPQTTITTGDGSFDGLNIRFDESTKKIVRVLGIALGLAWTFMLIYQLGKPGGSRQAIQKMGGVPGIIAALTVIVGSLNINTFMEVLDFFLRIGWAVLSAVKSAFGS